MKDLGILLSSLDLSKIPLIEMPPPAEDGRIPVLNGDGYATLDLEPLSQEFIDYSSKIKYPVLDAGAAYGLTSITALKKGATVICNEIEQKQLDYIAHIKSIVGEEKNRLYLKYGSILEIDFPDNSLGAIHISRVMHFFKPNEVEQFFEKAYNWLIPNGRIYIVTMSQYHYANPEGFSEKYNNDIKKGIEWPGMINEYKFKNERYSLHAIDPIVMMREANKFGFTCKKIELWGGPKDDDYTCAILVKDYHH
jgi:SAM-dependent methyltransferase